MMRTVLDKERQECYAARKIEQADSQGRPIRVNARIILGDAPDKQGKQAAAINLSWTEAGRRNRIYLSLYERYTAQEFAALCDRRKNGVKVSTARRWLDDEFNKVCGIVQTLLDDDRLTTDELKRQYLGIVDVERHDATFYDTWETIAHTKTVGTERAYLGACKRFRADMGPRIDFEDINKALVNKWRLRMQTGGVGITTINMHLRALRAILNEMSGMGYITEDVKAMFTKLRMSESKSRKHRYLDVPTWRKLWACYESNGAELDCTDYWRERYMEALGMMLFMYLANGMNLCDVLNLRYDDFYYKSGKRMMRFARHKTAARKSTEIVFPILPQLKTIIERQGEPEERGALVFSYLRDRGVRTGVNSRKEQERETDVTQLYNSVIRERMKKVCKMLGIDDEPSATYCRHSFASNLMQRQVPKDYISASMGHSCTTTTDNYIDCYGYATMVDYNSRLLADDDTAVLAARLGALTAEQRATLLAMIG